LHQRLVCRFWLFGYEDEMEMVFGLAKNLSMLLIAKQNFLLPRSAEAPASVVLSSRLCLVSDNKEKNTFCLCFSNIPTNHGYSCLVDFFPPKTKNKI